MPITFIGKIIKRKRMKFIRTLLMTIMIYTIIGLSFIYADSITPGVIRTTLSAGERKYESVTFTNEQNNTVELSIKPYGYNPQTDEITEDTKDIFIKADTDTIKVHGKSSAEIKYEIYPLDNMQEGTYFNILVITPVVSNKKIDINPSISQLIILDIVSPQNQVKGIMTDRYTIDIEVVKKGIPFISPMVIKYKITNNSNYLLIPQGRIDIFNEKNTYKSIYVYINPENQKLYPAQTLENEVKISQWYVSDLFLNRIVKGEIYNGIDGVPKPVETEVKSFTLGIIFLFVAILLSIFLVKSIQRDKKRKNKKD